MKFCGLCDNMMYIRSTAQNTMYICKMCNNEEHLSDGTGQVVITDTLLHDHNMKYRRYLSRYILEDATIPHVSNIVCPNTDCSRSSDVNNDVIVIKYDTDKLKFMYMCAHCKYYWLN